MVQLPDGLSGSERSSASSATADTPTTSVATVRPWHTAVFRAEVEPTAAIHGQSLRGSTAATARLTRSVAVTSEREMPTMPLLRHLSSRSSDYLKAVIAGDELIVNAASHLRRIEAIPAKCGKIVGSPLMLE
jgi:hypothetical protein